MKRLKESIKRRFAVGLMVLTVFIVTVYLVRFVIPPPDAVENRSPWYPISSANLLTDSSWLMANGQRVLDQSLFDALIQQIDEASGIILLDMFLFNAWQGPEPETHRALSTDMTEALIRARNRHPDMPIIVITDPVNTLYGGVESAHLQELMRANITVVQTPLVELQDSNPLYSAIWRSLIRPWGNRTDVETLKAPFGGEKISIRSWLSLLNFKANHRKLLITYSDSANRRSSNTNIRDGTVSGLGWQATVSSANPHDGSSAHRNVAVQFDGEAVKALLRTEYQLIQLASNATDDAIREPALAANEMLTSGFSSELIAPSLRLSNAPFTELMDLDTPLIRVLTEKAILKAVLDSIDAAQQGDEVNVLMFYLSHRSIVKALKQASGRGAAVRVLLDANKDAFGRSKNGVPNRPVAHELHNAGVQIRWCTTAGEQCHAKVLHTKIGAGQNIEQRLITGSGNYTRRNLDNLNLETNVDIRIRGHSELIEHFADYFNGQWHNRDNRNYSSDYEQFSDHSLLKKWQYRFMEASGVGTF